MGLATEQLPKFRTQFLNIAEPAEVSQPELAEQTHGLLRVLSQEAKHAFDHLADRAFVHAQPFGALIISATAVLLSCYSAGHVPNNGCPPGKLSQKFPSWSATLTPTTSPTLTPTCRPLTRGATISVRAVVSSRPTLRLL